MGCNSVCSYCIVPAVRGRELSRRPGEIVAEVTRLASDGVREVTLLGQNVNSWGRDLAARGPDGVRRAVARVDAVDGIERIRFTSPHPKDFRDPVIAAMAECEAVCEHTHLPLQSGSTRVLKAMRRTYGRERYLALVDKLRAAIPDLALTTDVIVGFPGETDVDFAGNARGRRGGALRRRLHVRLQPAERDRGRDDARPGSRGGQARSASSAWSRSSSKLRPSGTPSGSAGSRRCSSRARAGPILASARPDAAEHDRELQRGGRPGELVEVRIEGATSTTLRGTQAALVAA